MNIRDLFSNFEKPVIDRPLIAYAFLAQATKEPLINVFPVGSRLLWDNHVGNYHP
jgi:hypothetical protein